MPTEDRLLKIDEAATMLGTSKDFFYRHWKSLPFTVWLSERQLRFSSRGIMQYIAERAGKPLAPEGIQPVGEENVHAGPRV